MKKPTETQKPLILTVDEFLDADISDKLLEPALFLAYHKIPEVKQLVDSNADELGGGYCFPDIQDLDNQLYERIRIQLTITGKDTVELETFLANPTE